VLGRRETALAHLLGIFARCRPDLFAQAAIPLDEFRGELGEEAEHVVDHQDLPVAAGEPPIPIVGTATAAVSSRARLPEYSFSASWLLLGSLPAV
jgi:hypothetical protein